ncbi:MAG: hypothetical protein RJQ14_03600, partial [Marinoscillum sp.]
LGYTVDSKFKYKIGVSGVRIYSTAFNLFKITDSWVKPQYPERTNNGPGLGYDAGFGYPLAKTYTIGLNINL